MKPKDTYLTLSNHSEGFYREKGSKFLAFAFIVQNEDDVKAHLAELKKKYYDARHYCYAYILGKRAEKFRSNDDGEPGHAAGDPILGQIKSKGLTNTLIVVIRYFGGTKLGISGLINAYKTAAADAIGNNAVQENLILTHIKIRFEYPVLNQVMKLVKDHDLKIVSQKMDMSCEMTLGVRKTLSAAIDIKLKDLHEVMVMSRT